MLFLARISSLTKSWVSHIFKYYGHNYTGTYDFRKHGFIELLKPIQRTRKFLKWQV